MANKLLGLRVKAARRAKNMTQRDLAARVGTNQGHISRLEHGDKGVSTDVLVAIARVLDLSIADLSEVDGRGVEYPPDHPAGEILVDQNAPTGLRALAADKTLVDTLRVTPVEWYTLRSIALPATVSKEGYVQLLMTVRAISKPASGG